MKTALILSLLTFSGCSSVPKDALVKDLKVGATLWTPPVEASVIATGKAASNLTAEERKQLFQK